MEIVVSSVDRDIIGALAEWKPDEAAAGGAALEIEEPTRVPGISESAFEIIAAFGFTAVPVAVAVNLVSSWIFSGLQNASSPSAKARITVRAEGKETQVDVQAGDTATLERVVAAAMKNVRLGP